MGVGARVPVPRRGLRFPRLSAPARALANAFSDAHSAAAPAAYPELHHLTRPLRAAASAAGDPDGLHLWAGTGWRAVTEEPAGELVARLERERRGA